MMGTRSGDLDPGILVHLIKEKHYDADQLDDVVNEQAGLLGVSGISSDMKTLLELQAHHPNAAQAVEMFCLPTPQIYWCDGRSARWARHAGFHRWHWRARRASAVASLLGSARLGIHLDPNRNAANVDTISEPGSSCCVRVIPTNEDLMIARHTRSVVFSPALCG